MSDINDALNKLDEAAARIAFISGTIVPLFDELGFGDNETLGFTSVMDETGKIITDTEARIREYIYDDSRNMSDHLLTVIDEWIEETGAELSPELKKLYQYKVRLAE
ncbi:hypothetical protein QUF80_07860 [Desulfococcaceae bacterium HSG8]|nr:hypothetical protein [Desulfococcaceae bacterium HSG8]